MNNDVSIEQHCRDLLTIAHDIDGVIANFTTEACGSSGDPQQASASWLTGMANYLLRLMHDQNEARQPDDRLLVRLAALEVRVSQLAHSLYVKGRSDRDRDRDAVEVHLTGEACKQRQRETWR